LRCVRGRAWYLILLLLMFQRECGRLRCVRGRAWYLILLLLLFQRECGRLRCVRGRAWYLILLLLMFQRECGRLRCVRGRAWYMLSSEKHDSVVRERKSVVHVVVREARQRGESIVVTSFRVDCSEFSQRRS
jgi:hypothetical protein